MAIAQAVADEVLDLFHEGNSQRAIARKMNGRVSRATVSEIVNGRWKPHVYTSENDPERSEACAPVRCPGCGGRIVRVPCRTCMTRRRKKFEAEMAERRRQLHEALGGHARPAGEDVARQVHAFVVEGGLVEPTASSTA